MTFAKTLTAFALSFLALTGIGCIHAEEEQTETQAPTCENGGFIGTPCTRWGSLQCWGDETLACGADNIWKKQEPQKEPTIEWKECYNDFDCAEIYSGSCSEYSCFGGKCVVGNEKDKDGDGYGACYEDKDDHDKTVYPFAPELCDGKDNDGDGLIDKGCKKPCEKIDADGDGSNSCLDPNDNDSSIYPGAPEKCDGKDNNSNGTIDEGCKKPEEPKPCESGGTVCKDGYSCVQLPPGQQCKLVQPATPVVPESYPASCLASNPSWVANYTGVTYAVGPFDGSDNLRTNIISTSKGVWIGYIHFYGQEGSTAYFDNGVRLTERVRLDFAIRGDLTQSELVTASLTMNANELVVGSKHAVSVGALKFDFVVMQADVFASNFPGKDIDLVNAETLVLYTTVDIVDSQKANCSVN